MMKRFLPLLTVFLFVLALHPLIAQPTYYMSNQTVDDCEGIFLDSEQGDPSGTYDHNENYIFRICIPGADRIFMEFDHFCTEEDFDYFRIFDGPDTLSTMIGYYTGEPDPPFIVATSGCLTFHFFSDVSVTCTGWNARWWTEFDEPTPPDILPIPDLSCDAQSLTFTFAEPIPCDSLYLDAFSIIGPMSPAISAVDLGACTGGSTTTVTLNLAEPLSLGGNYQVIYRLYLLNSCDIQRELFSTEPFGIYDCPLSVQITGGENACAGSCFDLTAEAFGGNPNTYSYAWNPDLGNNATVQVCPIQSTIYSVTVSDAQGATAEAQLSIDPQPLPIINGGDLIICQSDDPFQLNANPPGGTWSGNGITDEQGGWYDPALTTLAQDTVTYTDLATGCTSNIAITINELDIGTDDAACPGTTPFYVSGGSPAGGNWSGPNIQPDGLFDPIAVGNFEVTYTHPNGCVGSKMVNVGDIILPQMDSLCQSDDAFTIAISPFGGEWLGEGITDVDEGIFDPGIAGAGEHELIYQINGCQDTLVLYVRGIEAGPNLSACPEQSPFVLPGNWIPTNGLWSGIGIVDPSTGLYDPALLSDGDNDTLTFSGNGCTASRIVFVRQTRIQVDTLEVCEAETSVFLDDETIGLVPEDGDWDGPGLKGALSGTSDPWEFLPDVAGVGIHLLVYDANTCLDSLWLRVHPSPQLQADTFCTEDLAVVLSVNIAGGRWRGPGIVNRNDGVFDPGIAGEGIHEVFYQSTHGCESSVEIIVVPPPTGLLDSLPDFLCFKDSVYLSTTFPTDEILVDGIPYPIFNPADFEPGIHTILFRGGVGECFAEAEKEITIGEPIQLILPFKTDSICFGENIILNVEASGGLLGAAFDYVWDQGLSAGPSHQVQPESTTTYTLIVSDGCSEPATAALTVHVHSEIDPRYSTGPRVCHEDTSYAQIFAFPDANYEFTWNTEPPFTGDFIEARPRTYDVEVLNLNTGCRIDTEVRIPGFAPVKANFGFSPNVECLSILDAEIELLDFSVGGTGGFWDFGDGSIEQPYNIGSHLTHVFADTGNYTVSLHLINEGNCSSEFALEICVEEDYRLFAPNAFTPNYDGKNDEFHFKGIGIEEFNYQVFNRWGEMLFEGQGMEDAWNGQFKGKMVQSGVYTYVAQYKTLHSTKTKIKKGVITVLY